MTPKDPQTTLQTLIETPFLAHIPSIPRRLAVCEQPPQPESQQSKRNERVQGCMPGVLRDVALERDELVVEVLVDARIIVSVIRDEREDAGLTRASRSTMFSECLYGIVPFTAPLIVEKRLADVNLIESPNWSVS